jgi:putative transposase
VSANKPLLSKPHRLKTFSYRGHYAYSVTLCTKDGMPRFEDSSDVKQIEDILRREALKEDFELYIYCFMPDHLHLLVKGKREESDMKHFITSFKQQSGFIFKQKYKEALWQNSYYDHVLRKDEDITIVSRYILENPVRKGFVDDYREYPFSGSDVCDINEMW